MMKGAIMISAFAAQLASGEVVSLTPDNFDAVTGKGGALVKFFAPWCGHCKTMAPHYIADSENMPKGAGLYEMDCDSDANKEVCTVQMIRGFPSLKWFDADGSVVDYDGGRGAGAFKEWTAEMLKPVVHNVTEVPKDITGKMHITLSSDSLKDEFVKAAKENRKHVQFNFLPVEAGWFGFGNTSTLILSKEGELPDVVSADTVTVEAINKLVSDHRFPAFGELSGETYGDYVSRPGRDMLWTLLKFQEGDMVQSVDAVRSDMEALAKDFSQFSFTYTDTVQFAQPIEGMLGITSDMLPAVAVQRGKQKFVMKGEDVTKENVETFLQGIESGAVKPDVKSEPVPENNDGTAVRQVVATTMKSELFHEDKDVLVKVYAPWCGHCQTMAPEFESTANDLKASVGDKVVLAKIDGSANDSTIDSMEWQGFPTLFFIKAGSKEAMPYDGPRDKAGILEWIKNNSDQDLEKAIEAALEKDGQPTDEL